MKQLLRRLIDHAGVSAAAPAAFLAILVGAAIVTQPVAVRAQTLEDPTLAVSTVVSGLSQSIAMAFIGPDDFLVTEKATWTSQACDQRRRHRCGARPGCELQQ